MMSLFFNGILHTMKANYWAEGNLRVVRPLIYVREEVMRESSESNELPVIKDNCPACFAEPKERHKAKLLLSGLEFEHRDLFGRILTAVAPLLDVHTADTLFQRK